MSAEFAPRISVIAPVYRDWDDLRHCLAALASQTWPRTDIEVLVADNDEAPGITPSRLGNLNLRLSHEPAGHSYTARNAGSAAAQGELLAFTDTDCRPAPDWLAAGWAVFEDGIDLADGPVEISDDGVGLAVDYEWVFAFPQEFNAQQSRSMTANLFVRRRDFAACGRGEASLQSNGDFEFCRRASRGIYKLVYAAQSRGLRPPRRTVSALLRKSRRTAVGFRFSEIDSPGAPELTLGAAMRILSTPRIRHGARLITGEGRMSPFGTLRRRQLLALHIVLNYHFAFAVLRLSPPKDRH